MNLDSLITKNRDRASLGLATVEEIAELVTGVGIDNPAVIDMIDDWRMIAQRVDNKVAICLLGISRRDQSPRITSSVECIDYDIVRTANSHYGLGTRGVGEPPDDQIQLFIQYLRRKGVGELLGLP